MPKGRKFAPETDCDGNWFRHRTRGYETPKFQRQVDTSTGQMLTTPFGDSSQSSQMNTPPKFATRLDYVNTQNAKRYDQVNPFSWHDNRNSFQDHGEYFGHGLGKQSVVPVEKSLHYSNNYIRWTTREGSHTDNLSSYAVSFRGDRDTESPTRRRFPRTYSEPRQGGIKLDTTTTDWSNESHRTPLQVMASAQEPFLPHNPWRYSYKAHEQGRNPLCMQN
ncbi:PREDICTED: testis-expressed sequence 36 protein-like [Branchiostoma belcheri]|uniref:Testis-expressed sequence 36 protein-like n=1 Tax=Branchiostoma belcheri TaxID=7741 RepID=A0A6P4YW13_BRABE|nr:PREDICTED: testis-expressed sequence 36 protein-like [Branchiostoma belcheri]